VEIGRDQARDLTETAATAAHHGDCESVRRLGPLVLAYDSDHYKNTFLTNAEIKRCLALDAPASLQSVPSGVSP
jgi:hypothetical protein